MGAWALRYILFSLGAPDTVSWMILGGIILHGVCYDFFFVAGFIYIDKKAAPEIRAQAQGFIVLATYGFGMLIGSQLGGFAFNRTVTEGSANILHQWQLFWAYPAILAIAVMVYFMLMFKDPKVDQPAELKG
jgi:MFS family permease